MNAITTVTPTPLALVFSDGTTSVTIPKSSIESVEVFAGNTKYVEVVLERDYANALTFSKLFLDYNVVTNPSAGSAAALAAAVKSLVNDQGTPGNVGAAGASTVVASETGDETFHKTVLTLTNFVIGAIPGAANLALGANVYTLPAGTQVIEAVSLNLSLANDDGNIDADTPDLGLGSVIATGAVALLSGTATFENILTGQTMNDCNGTAEVVPYVAVPTVGQGFITGTSGSKNIFLNVADGWAGAETELKANGTITLFWKTV